MSIEKTPAIVVSLIPWRETSFIVTLFTKEHGMISAVAKGVRRSKQPNVPLERGQIIDTVVYMHHNRSMQTLADIQIVSFHQSIRSDLEKTALRDLVLELLQKSIHDTHPHPELYERVLQCFVELDCSKLPINNYLSLWTFIRDYTDLLGFRLTFERCVSCSKEFVRTPDGGYLIIQQGGLICKSCNNKNLSGDYLITNEVIKSLMQNDNKITENCGSILQTEILRMTKLLVSYCKLHMEIHGDFRSITFLEEIHL